MAYYFIYNLLYIIQQLENIKNKSFIHHLSNFNLY